MSYIDQRIFADPSRDDGHDADGNPGDCMRATLASLMNLPYEAVPHFAQYVSWWDYMRHWARKFGVDFACLSPEDTKLFLEPTDLVMGSGPSPRGDFWHACLYNANLELVHDPHPSRLGLVSLEECIVVLPWPSIYEPNQLRAITGV